MRHTLTIEVDIRFFTNRNLIKLHVFALLSK
jgi:hypothetical protein